MQIKTDSGERNVASNGLGVWGAVGGGLGTLALANQLFNGNGLLGLNGGAGGVNTQNNQCNDTRTIAALQAELGKEKAERYADSVSINTFKEAQAADEKLSSRIATLENFAHVIDKQVAVDKQATQDNFAFLNNKIDTTKDEILCYCNASFVPGKLVMPLDSICPEAMQRYNSWEAPTSSTTSS